MKRIALIILSTFISFSYLGYANSEEEKSYSTNTELNFYNWFNINLEL